MELEIRIRGTEDQINKLLAENSFLEVLVNAGQISKDDQGDNPEMIEALWELSWETLHLAHIIFVHGTENAKGRYMSKDDLLSYQLNSKGKTLEEGNLSARVGGAKKKAQSYKLPDFLRIKTLVSGEKRYYLTHEAVPSLEQVINLHDRPLREWYEDKGFFYPGSEDE